MASEKVIRCCPNCGKKLTSVFIYCEEWCQYLFCSWECVLEFSEI